MLNNLQGNQENTLLNNLAFGGQCIGSEVIEVSNSTPRGVGGHGSPPHYLRTPKFKEFIGKAKAAICTLIVTGGDPGANSPLAYFIEHPKWDSILSEPEEIRTYGQPLDHLGVVQISTSANLGNFRIISAENLPSGVTLCLRVFYYQ